MDRTEMVCPDSPAKRRDAPVTDTCRNPGLRNPPFLLFFPICQQPRFSVSLRRFPRRAGRPSVHGGPAVFLSTTSPLPTRGQHVSTVARHWLFGAFGAPYADSAPHRCGPVTGQQGLLPVWDNGVGPLHRCPLCAMWGGGVVVEGRVEAVRSPLSIYGFWVLGFSSVYHGLLH